MSESVESRAVKIAAEIMVDNGICRYGSPLKCRRVYTDEKICGKCIEKWILTKARKDFTGSGYEMTDDELMKFRFQRKNMKKKTGQLAKALRMDRKDFEAAVRRGIDDEARRSRDQE